MELQIKMVGAHDATAQQVREAVQRYRRALADALGGALEIDEGIEEGGEAGTEQAGATRVVLVYRAYLQLRGVYGETPDLEQLTDAERTIYEQWHDAHSAALVAALGPHRYLEEPQFEISLPQ